jgi:hypothetical protein
MYRNVTEDELRQYMDEWRNFGCLFIRARWTMDGAKTLIDAAQRFRDRADTLEGLARAGFELDQPADNGFAIAVRPGERSPMRLVEADAKANP